MVAARNVDGRWGDPDCDESWRVKLHHALVRDAVGYCAWWDKGLVILDLTDLAAPRLISHLEFGHEVGRATHTACPLPGRQLLVVTEERVAEGCVGVTPNVHLVDVADPTQPQVTALFPVPEGDFCGRGAGSGRTTCMRADRGRWSTVRPST